MENSQTDLLGVTLHHDELIRGVSCESTFPWNAGNPQSPFTVSGCSWLLFGF